MALKFGTSGVRGLVSEMTDRECTLYTRAFIHYLKSKQSVSVISLAGDLRNSTPRILRAIAFAVKFEGLDVDYCGYLPTPALTLHAMSQSRPSIMVTGSHIPADRNGIKFNMPWGEVLKDDESGISALYRRLKNEENEIFATSFDNTGACKHQDGWFRDNSLADSSEWPSSQREVIPEYQRRYLCYFEKGCLTGLRVVVYEHSSVARDILPFVLSELGADIICEGRSKDFIAVDTEAIESTAHMERWIKKHGADALVSADGDGDRPLVIDARGNVVRGDILGILTATYLQADSVTTPVSSNTTLELCGRFPNIRRTRIGSPFVIAGMQSAEASGSKRAIGYEANGGFMMQSDIINPINGSVLRALPTRDALLPIVAVMHLAKEKGNKLSALVAELPPRYTMSGIIRNFPSELGKLIVERFRHEGSSLAEMYFARTFGSIVKIEFTDGVRMFFENDKIVHFRPSGNAPEMRCYTEASSVEASTFLNREALKILNENIRPDAER